MANLLNCQSISRAYSGKALFNNVTFGVEDNDKIAIIGANGSGKTTLLRIMAGREDIDSGNVTRRKDLSMIYVQQVSDFDPNLSAFAALKELVASSEIAVSDVDSEVKRALSLAGFDDYDVLIKTLSGGWKKRLAIAEALVGSPDLVLLDEPTNHLDLKGVLWLEQLLRQASFAWVVVSHDRYFLDRTVKKTMELGQIYKNGVLIADTGYSEFLTKRSEFLAEQAAYADSLANKVRREEDWLSRAPQARATKAKSRIGQAHDMQAELAALKKRLVTGSAGIEFSSSGRKTKKLITCENISIRFGDKILIDDFSLVLTPGTKLGLLGPNGSGKSTLLKLMAKLIEPNTGSVAHAEQLRLVYFDQNRDSLKPEWTLKRALSDAGDAVIYNGRSQHIASWAKRFGFNSDQLDIPVSELSGGEQARVLIARLMLQPADVLLLDEPTNDLDIPTLEVLEESLLDFEGAIIIISHDRYLMEQVCDACVGLDGEGSSQIYADFTQWQTAVATPKAKKAKEQVETEKAKKPAQTKRLSYMDQRDYDRLEGDIGKAEQILAEAQSSLEDPALASSSSRLLEATKAVEVAQAKVDALYARWEELESKLQ